MRIYASPAPNTNAHAPTTFCRASLVNIVAVEVDVDDAVLVPLADADDEALDTS